LTKVSAPIKTLLLTKIPPQKKKGFWNYIKNHKWLSGIGLVVIIVILFFIYRAFAAGSTPTTYVFAQAQTGTLISSVSGTGQIIAGSSVSLKPASSDPSATVTEVDVSVGQEVTKGQKIAVLSDQQVTAALIQAEANAETAKANYDKTVNGSNSPQTIAASQLSITNAEQNLQNSVETNYTTINNMIQTTLDPYFGDAESSSPLFGITFIDSSTNLPVTLTSNNTNQNIDLGYERASVGNVLNEWQTEIASASTTNASGAVQLAQDSQKYLTIIQNFVNDFAATVNSISLSYTKYQTYVNSANSAAASAQSTVTGAVQV
jgi:multidrug efflux pump subunit AcrA (membrane-fusion protein)